MLSDEDLNIILDGLEDTLIKNYKGELKQEDFNYVTKVMVMKKRIERELHRRKLYVNSQTQNKENKVSKNR